MSGQSLALRAAHSRWCRNRRKMIALGTWEPFVDAQPVRERIWAMNAAGMPTRTAAQKIGLHPKALDHLMWKRNGVASDLVRKETAEAVMAYWPTLDDFPAHCLIDATGSRRRVQALMTLGWPQRYLAGLAGVSDRSFSRALTKPRVTAALARQIASCYDQLWSRAPGPSEVMTDAACRVRGYARAMGFVGPLAWDDDTIDDSNAVPQTDAAQPVATEGGNVAARWLMGESVILGSEDRRQVVKHLFEWTVLTKEEIAGRLEMTPAAAEQMWIRIKKKAREEGRPEPWRRVYALRDKNLSRKHMEEAA